MTEFKNYLIDNGIKNIRALSYLTGIDEAILNGVSDGKYSLGRVHKSSIKSILPDMPDTLLSPKHKVLPSDIITEKSKIPEGTNLMNLQAVEIKIGDLLLAAHQTAVAGSHWVVVSSIKEQGKNLIIGVGNNIEIGVSKTNLVKVARTQ